MTPIHNTFSWCFFSHISFLFSFLFDWYELQDKFSTLTVEKSSCYDHGGKFTNLFLNICSFQVNFISCIKHYLYALVCYFSSSWRGWCQKCDKFMFIRQIIKPLDYWGHLSKQATPFYCKILTLHQKMEFSINWGGGGWSGGGVVQACSIGKFSGQLELQAWFSCHFQ